MASILQPNVQAFLALSAVELGDAVKLDSSDPDKVEKATANTDLAIGVAQCAAAAGETVEVALVGGGAKARAGEAIAAGKAVVAGADGELFQTNADGDRIVGIAMDDAVANDIFPIQVSLGVATGADQ